MIVSPLDKSTPCSVNSTFRKEPKADFHFSSPLTKYNSLTSRTSLKRKPSTIWLGEVNLIGADWPEICQECGKKPPKMFAAVTSLGSNISKNVCTEECLSQKFKRLMGISESPATSSASYSLGDRQSEKRSVLPPERSTNPNNIATELSIKKNMSETQNLVQEIIKELSDKCTLKSLPGTKNFVKSLVNDLRGDNTFEVPEIPEEQEVIYFYN